MTFQDGDIYKGGGTEEKDYDFPEWGRRRIDDSIDEEDLCFPERGRRRRRRYGRRGQLFTRMEAYTKKMTASKKWIFAFQDGEDGGMDEEGHYFPGWKRT